MRKSIAVVTVLLVGLLLLCSGIAMSAVPQTMNYQGFLTDKATGQPVTATLNMMFSIYDAEGAPDEGWIWREFQTGVSVENGVYSVTLGSVDPSGNPLDIAFDTQYWLGISIGNDSQLSPRQQLTSVGYAVSADYADAAGNASTANNADTLDGIDSTEFQRPLLGGSLGCPVGTSIKTLHQNGVFSCETDDVLTEAQVEGYIANDVASERIPYSNGTKLTASSMVFQNTGGGQFGMNITDPTANLHVYRVVGGATTSADVIAKLQATSVADTNYHLLEGYHGSNLQFYIGGNGGASFKGGVEVPANQDFKYSTPRTYYKQLPAAAFVEIFQRNEYGGLQVQSRFGFWAGGDINEAGPADYPSVVPVDLPDGAEIKKFTVYYRNNGGAWPTNFKLLEASIYKRGVLSSSGLAIATVMANSDDFPSSSIIRSPSTQSIPQPLVDNAASQYYIYLQLFSNICTSYAQNPCNLDFFGATIEYQLSGLRP
jgi:hypothetical protein